MHAAFRLCLTALGLLVVSCLVANARAEEKYTLKEAELTLPTQLKEAVRTQLSPKAIQVYDSKGELYCEVWFRKSIPVKATDVQVKNGLGYQELPQTSLIGAIRFAQEAKDYRKQSVKAGVYTLRVAFQPQDGDHMGTAPHTEFCLLGAPDHDTKPDLLDPKALHDISARSLGGSHPAVFLLFPHLKPEKTPKLVDQGMGHWVIKHTLDLEVNGKKVILGIGLNVVGHSPGA